MPTNRILNSAQEPRVILGYKGFRELYLGWKEGNPHPRLLILSDELDALGKINYWLLARRCAKLTEREAISVVNAVCFDGLNHEPESANSLSDAYQKIMIYLELNSTLSKLEQIVTVCCELSPIDDPYYEMLEASRESDSNVETARQELAESVFGLGRKRTNHLRGDAMNLLSDRRIPADEVEWFGANWKTVAPLWVFLSAEHTLTRARVEALLNKSEDTPSSLLDGVL